MTIEERAKIPRKAKALGANAANSWSFGMAPELTSPMMLAKISGARALRMKMTTGVATSIPIDSHL